MRLAQASYCLLLSATFAAAPVLAQTSAQEVTLPATTPPVTDEVLALEADAASRMTVQVRLGETATRNFIVDTGASRSAISAEAAAQLNFATSGSLKVNTMNGQTVVQAAIIPKLGVANSTILNVRAPVLLAKDMGADGILGIDGLQKKRILIDFRSHNMAIFESSEPELPEEPDVILVMAKSKFGQLILVDADVDGRKLSVILDTGAQNSVGNSVLRSVIAKNNSRKAPLPIDLVGVTGEKTRADFTSIDRIRIGGFRLTNVPVAYADAYPFKKFKLTRKPALLLGMDVLRKFDRVSIDFAKREIKFLLPRAPKQ
jgi:predicted aspartyl protease